MSAESSKGALLYVSDFYGVQVYSYPSGAQVGSLTGFQSAAGLCVDKAADVFVTDTLASDIVEYAHGGTTPIAILLDPNEAPFRCSVDPTSGNLAVTDIDSHDVSIYPDARGQPRLYSDPYALMEACGYDDKGNLYVNGRRTHIAVLPKGAKAFRDIRLSKPLDYPANIQWDGTYLALGDGETHVIYRVKVSGSNGTVIGVTHLGGAQDIGQFWIQDNRIIGPDSSLGQANFWRYPAGGAVKKFVGGLTLPYGSAVSIARK
jgi:hypothetical protein